MIAPPIRWVVWYTGGIEVVAEVLALADDRLRVHRFGDLAHLAGHVLRHPDVVVLPVEGHAQQRLAVGVLVGRIEVEVVVAVGHGARRGRPSTRCGCRHPRPPLSTRCPRSACRAASARPPIGLEPAWLTHIGEPPTKPSGPWSKLSALKSSTATPLPPAPTNGLVLRVLVEERLDGGHVLVGEVAPHHALAGDRVVGLADAGQQQQVHVVELERADDHQIRRLHDLAALGVDVGHAGGALPAVAVEVDLQHVAVGAQLELRLLAQRRQDVQVRRGLGIHVAGVAAAEAAEVARPHLHAVGVGVGPRGVGRRQVVGVLAHRLRRLSKQLGRPGALLRGQREVAGAVRRRTGCPCRPPGP